MKRLTILDLRVGDLVVDDNGRLGEVIGFRRDGVRIEWEGNLPSVSAYTDDQLLDFGIVLVDGQ